MSAHRTSYSHAGMEEPRLERGKSILNPRSHRGRTSRERAKQARRAARIMARSHADKAGQGKPGKS